MSHSNEKLVEEILNRAFELGIYNEVMERAISIMKKGGVRRSIAFDTAFQEISKRDEIHGKGHTG